MLQLLTAAWKIRKVMQRLSKACDSRIFEPKIENPRFHIHGHDFLTLCLVGFLLHGFLPSNRYQEL
jgi:hypothetical protein